jgi:hypothetical protein
MPNYFYNPCSPCCSNQCGWGPLTQYNPADVTGFTSNASAGTPTWKALGNGQLTMTGGTGSFGTKSNNPDSTGLLPPGHPWNTGCVTVSATLETTASSTKSGVFIGNGRTFYADWVAGNYVHVANDPNGLFGSGAPTTVVASGPKSGDKISLCIGRVADGSFTIAYSVNSVVVAVETEQGLTNLADPTSTGFNSGFYGETAAQFGTSSAVCGTSCPPSTCNQCQTALAQCWYLQCSGVTQTGGSPFAAANGQFCLVAYGCTLTANPNGGSWTVTIGSNPYTSSGVVTQPGGSVMTLQTNVFYVLNSAFNCNGPNTFTLYRVNSGTQGWPQTITITPYSCGDVPCVPCQAPPSCSTYPSYWAVGIAGITNGCWTALNGTYELTRDTQAGGTNSIFWWNGPGGEQVQLDISISMQGTAQTGCPFWQVFDLYLTSVSCGENVVHYGSVILTNSTNSCSSPVTLSLNPPNVVAGLPATITVTPMF